MKKVVIALAFALLLVGCGSKETAEPETNTNAASIGAKQRSAEVVYHEVEYCYTLAVMNNDGANPTLADVEAELAGYALTDATISGNVITTDAGIECRLSNSNGLLSISCSDLDGTNALDGWVAPSTGTLALQN